MKRKNKSVRFLLPLYLAAAIFCCSACSSKAEPISETRLLLDTVCTVTLYQPADAALLAEALDLCAAYEALFSRTREGSDIWRINQAAGEAVAVAPETLELIRLGLAYGEQSGGLFDISIGRVAALWDFGGSPAVPEAAPLAAALATVDYRQVEIKGDTVRLSQGGWLDLGGIAKGYIADRLADFLRQNGVESALIDLGGNILTVGEKPAGGAWRIGVEQPFSDRSELLGALSVGQASVVTSGIYQRQFRVDGQLYHHILDPQSGYPAETDLQSVTVVSAQSVAGDALSTLLLLQGSAAAAETLSQAEGIHGALLLLKSGELLQYGDLAFEAQP